jgi:hypothetical protein
MSNYICNFRLRLAVVKEKWRVATKFTGAGVVCREQAISVDFLHKLQ